MQTRSQEARRRFGNLARLGVSEYFVHLHHRSRAKVGRDAVREERRQPRASKRHVIPVVSPTEFGFMGRTQPNQLSLEPGCLRGDVVTCLREITICGEAKTQSLGITAEWDFQGLTEPQTAKTLAELNEQETGQRFPRPGSTQIRTIRGAVCPSHRGGRTGADLP